MLEMLYTKFTLKKLPSMVPLMDDSSARRAAGFERAAAEEVSVKGERHPGHEPQTLTRRAASPRSSSRGSRRCRRRRLRRKKEAGARSDARADEDAY